MGQITIKDIAKETGLSIATVSYVLNGKDNVLKETKQKVLDAAERLGYVRNYSARSLVMRASNLIGVVIPQTEPGKVMVFENPFYSEILSSIEYHARKIGYHIIVSGTDVDEQYFQLAKERNLDGIIIVGVYSDAFYSGIKNARIPVVLIDSYIEGTPFHSVRLNDEESAYQAVTYLIGKGHRDIAILSGKLKDGGVCEKRFQGYKRALGEAGIPALSERILAGNTDFESGMMLAEKMLRTTKVSAVFCSADILALGAVKKLTEQNIRIPGDISVMGFDNLSIARYCYPGLTTVGQDVFEKGKKAVRLIENSICNKLDKPMEIILETQIVERESVSGRA